MDQFFNNLFTSPTNDAGVNKKYHTTTKAKGENGYCRAELPFFAPDPFHAHLLSIGAESEIAFPDKDDIPTSKNEHFSFDVYYLIVNGKYHRITLTRSHRITSVYHACFIDGHVVWAASPHSFLLINQAEWNSSFESVYPYRFSFFVGETTKIYVYANSGLNAHAKMWQLPVTKHPLYYGIFVNNQNIDSGLTVEEENLRGKLCPATIYLVLLFPFWVLWILLAACAFGPCLYYARSCKVRRYLIEGGEEGLVRKRELMGKEYSLEKVSLLGSIHPQENESNNVQ